MTTLNTPAPEAKPTLMTADEFAAFVHRPENDGKWFELVRGEVIELPPPTRPHGRVCMNAGFLLETYVRQRRKGYVTSNDAGVLLERDPDTVRGPDVALHEDAQRFEDIHPKYGEVPPVLAVEVLSPSDKATAVLRKTESYLRNGVKLVWVIDPEDKTVSVYRHDRSFDVFGPEQELSGGDILPSFSCKVADLFLVPG